MAETNAKFLVASYISPRVQRHDGHHSLPRGARMHRALARSAPNRLGGVLGHAALRRFDGVFDSDVDKPQNNATERAGKNLVLHDQREWVALLVGMPNAGSGRD